MDPGADARSSSFRAMAGVYLAGAAVVGLVAVATPQPVPEHNLMAAAALAFVPAWTSFLVGLLLAGVALSTGQRPRVGWRRVARWAKTGACLAFLAVPVLVVWAFVSPVGAGADG